MLRNRLVTIGVAWTAFTIAAGLSVPSLAQNRREEPPHPQKENRAQARPQSQGRAQAQGHAGEWLRDHRNMSPEQQRKALENDPRFRSLPPQRQQQLRNQLQRFNTLPAEKQEQTLRRMETWEHLTPEQKQQARQLHDQMQQLPPERRQAIRNAVESLRAMPPDARQRTIDSDAYKSHFSPQEREMLGNASRLPLAPAEPNEQGPEP